MLSGVSERVVERTGEKVRGSPSGTGIVNVQFDVMNDEEVLACSVADIDTPDIWLSGSPVPVKGGLLDPRMGSLGREVPCETCNATHSCPGHMGSISLPRAVLCGKAIERVKTLLRLHCHHCGTLLAWGERRREALEKAENALRFSGGDKDLALHVLATALGTVGSKPKDDKSFNVCRPAKNAGAVPRGGAENAPPEEGSWCGRVQPHYWINKAKRFGKCTPSGRAWFLLRATWPDRDPERATAPFVEVNGVAGKTFSLTGERVSFLLETVLRGQAMVPSVFPTQHDARVFLEALTPRVLPVLPPQGRPTDGVSLACGPAAPGEGVLRLNDVTKRYRFVLRAAMAVSEKMSTFQGEGAAKRGRDGARRLPLAARVLSGPWEESTMEDDVLEDSYAALQQCVDALMDEKSASAPPRGCENLSLKSGARSLATDFDHKNGLMRGNIQGKRSNFTGRSVITPDPNMPLDVLAIPGEMADRLTVPVRVNDLNQGKLTVAASCQDTVLRCRDVGASTRSVFFDDKSARDLNYKPWSPSDEGPVPVGSTVEVTVRQAVDELGMTQRCIFNRQPTLHRPSMLAERIVVTPGARKTLAFKETQVTGFNADFDGDEMNVYLPQSETAHAEIAELMGVERHAKLPRNGGACYGAIQDTLTASYLFTRKDVFFERDEAMEMVMSAATQYALPQERQLPANALPAPAILKAPGAKGPLWTGKQMASLALPPWLNVDRPRGQDAEDCVGGGKTPGKGQTIDWPWSDCGVFIRQGVLLCGRFDKSAVGARRGSVGDCIEGSAVDGGGSEGMANFLNCLSALAVQYFMQRGFSVGLADIMLPNEAMERVNRAVDAVDGKMREIVRRHQLAPRNAGVCGVEDAVDALERDLIATQDSCRNEAGEIATAVATNVPENRLSSFLVMAKAGSKGSAINFQQVTTCLGGQMIQHRRVVDRFLGDANASRPAQERVFHLPAGGAVQVKREALGSSRALTFGGRGKVRAFSHLRDCEYPLAEAGGFARNSLLAGLTPIEFMFHAMGGREGLKNTANDTADTGYAQRKMIKNLEDVHVAYDGTVRNCAGGIVQFWYGPDPCRSKPAKSREDAAKSARNADWSAFPGPGRGDDAEEIAFRDACEAFSGGARVARDEARAEGNLRAAVLARVLPSTGAAQVPCLVRPVIEEVLGNDALFKRLRIIFARITERWEREEAPRDHAGAWPCLPHHDKRAEFFWRLWREQRDAACREFGHDPLCMVRGMREVRAWLGETVREPNPHFEGDVLCELSSRALTCSTHVSLQHLKAVLGALRAAYLKCSVTPGDCVGVLAAQSLGESATQKTLNSFHVAGTSAATVGGGEKFAQLIAATPACKQRGRQVVLQGFTEAACAAQAGFVLQKNTFFDIAVAYSVAYCPLQGHVLSERLEPCGEPGSGDVRVTRTVVWCPENLFSGGPVPCPFVDERERLVAQDFYATMPTVPVEGHREPVHEGEGEEDDNGLCMEAPTMFCSWEVPFVEANSSGACPGKCARERKVALQQDPQKHATQVPACFGSFLLVLSLRAEWFEKAGLSQSLGGVSEFISQTVFRSDEAFVWMTPDTNAGGPAVEDEDGHRCVKVYVRAKLCGAKKKKTVPDGETATGENEGDACEEAAGGAGEVRLLQEMLQRLLRAPISGPRGPGQIKSKIVEGGKSVVCDTEDLQYVLSLDGVDGRDVVTNQVSTVLKIFGVEAAATLLAQEYESMVQSGGGSVSPQHTTLVADVMSQTGEILAFDRHGITKRHSDFLLHASFERTSHTLQKAAFGGRRLQTKFMSPSAAVMFGMQAPTVGTGAFSVYLDTDALRAMEPVFDTGVTETARALENDDCVVLPRHGTPAVQDVPEWMRERQLAYSPGTGADDLCVFSPVRADGMEIDEDEGDGARNEINGALSKKAGKSFRPRDFPLASEARSETDWADFARDCPSFTHGTSSPVYSPSSPAYNPSSPVHGVSSPAYSPSSPAYEVSSPAYSSSSPAYSPSSPAYSPSSPAYSPSSPAYSPSSPAYSPSSPAYSPSSPAYSPSSPALSTFLGETCSPTSASFGEIHEAASSPADAQTNYNYEKFANFPAKTISADAGVVQDLQKRMKVQ